MQKITTLSIILAILTMISCAYGYIIQTSVFFSAMVVLLGLNEVYKKVDK